EVGAHRRAANARHDRRRPARGRAPHARDRKARRRGGRPGRLGARAVTALRSCVRRRLAALVIVLATIAWARAAHAEPVRILVAVGHKMGLAAERPLKYADNDAARVRDVLVGFGGVRAEQAFVLNEPSRAQLFAAIDRARAEAQRHRPDEVTLVFYFSGHGDREAIHLGDDRVTM